MADNFRTDLDQLLPQRRQRPLLHGIGQRQGTHEVAEVTAEGQLRSTTFWCLQTLYF